MSANMRSTLQTVPESLPADHVTNTTNTRVSCTKSDLRVLSRTSRKTTLVLCASHPRLGRPRNPLRLGDNEKLRARLPRDVAEMLAVWLNIPRFRRSQINSGFRSGLLSLPRVPIFPLALTSDKDFLRKYAPRRQRDGFNVSVLRSYLKFREYLLGVYW